MSSAYFRGLLVLWALASSACSSDEEVAPAGGGGKAGAAGAAAASGTGGSDAGTGGGAGVAGDAAPQVGGYMQICKGDGGLECDPGLTCKQYVWSSSDGGFSSCGRRLCTQPCDAGCPSPAIGCDTSGVCEPPVCYP